MFIRKRTGNDCWGMVCWFLVILSYMKLFFSFSEKVSLFCGNLDPDLTSETLKGFFEANGIEVLAARKSERKRYFHYIRKKKIFKICIIVSYLFNTSFFEFY